MWTSSMEYMVPLPTIKQTTMCSEKILGQKKTVVRNYHNCFLNTNLSPRDRLLLVENCPDDTFKAAWCCQGAVVSIVTVRCAWQERSHGYGWNLGFYLHV